MLVQKFGGSSLATVDGFQASGALIQRFAEDEPVVVVLSAVYGVTNLLIEAIEAAVAGEDTAPIVDAILSAEQDVIDGLKALGCDAPVEIEGRPENVTFSLPKELRIPVQDVS